MNCEQCGQDPDVIVIMPGPGPRGELDLLLCFACAKQSPLWCQQHQRPHQGFLDGSSCCLACAQELASQEFDQAVKLHDSFRDQLTVGGAALLGGLHQLPFLGSHPHHRLALVLAIGALRRKTRIITLISDLKRSGDWMSLLYV